MMRLWASKDESGASERAAIQDSWTLVRVMGLIVRIGEAEARGFVELRIVLCFR